MNSRSVKNATRPNSTVAAIVGHSRSVSLGRSNGGLLRNGVPVPTDPALEPKYGSSRSCLGKGGYLALDVEDEYIDIKYYERKLGTCLDRFRLKPSSGSRYPGTRTART